MSQRRWLATAVIFRPSDVSLGFAETWTVIAPATAEMLEGGSRVLVRRWRKPVDQWLSETAAPIGHSMTTSADTDLCLTCLTCADLSRHKVSLLTKPLKNDPYWRNMTDQQWQLVAEALRTMGKVWHPMSSFTALFTTGNIQLLQQACNNPSTQPLIRS